MKKIKFSLSSATGSIFPVDRMRQSSVPLLFQFSLASKDKTSVQTAPGITYTTTELSFTVVPLLSVSYKHMTFRQRHMTAGPSYIQTETAAVVASKHMTFRCG